MNNITLEKILKVCNGSFYGDNNLLNTSVSGITIDSRKVEEGFLFIPIKGERYDGNDFIDSAYEKKAICCLTEKRPKTNNHPYILVDSCFQAFKDLAEYYRSLFSAKVIAITGSVGKTTTKEMAVSILSQKYRVLKTQGNYNNEIGLPLTLLNIKEDCEVVVLEMGMNNFGEISRLSKMARPDVCVLTNIGVSHIENLKSREGILKAKTEIFEYMNKDGTVILNGDDDMLSTLKNSKLNAVFYGICNTNDIYADKIIDMGLEGTNCNIHFSDNNINVHIPSPGKHMIYNSLAAAAVGKALGLSNEEIKKGIETSVPASNRMNITKGDDITIINDVYNASPASVNAAIDVLCYSAGRKVCILGDMFELGEHSAQFHYDVGQYAALKNIDLIICAGNMAKHISLGAIENGNGCTVVYFYNQDIMINAISNLILKDDTVLVKASRGMQFENTVEELQKTIRILKY